MASSVDFSNENDFVWMYDISDHKVQEWYELFYPKRHEKRLYEFKKTAEESVWRRQIEMSAVEYMEHPDEAFSSSSSPSLPSTSSSPTFEPTTFERPNRRNASRNDRINLWVNKNQTTAANRNNQKPFKISKWIPPSKNNKYCSFCFKNHELPMVYNGHSTRSSDGQITCPILLEVVCPNCGGTGQDAHTPNYCPKKAGSKAAKNNSNRDRQSVSFGDFM